MTELKNTHSKARNIRYDKLQLQSYLKSGNTNLTIKEKQFVYSARTRMLDIKGNFKTKEIDILCRKCNIAEELQEHIVVCPGLGDSSVVVEVPKYEEILGQDPTQISIMGRILKYKYELLKTPCAPLSAVTTIL